MAKKKAARKTRRKATKDLSAKTRRTRGARGGASFMPEPNDEVVVAFRPGTARAGAVLGQLWSGSDKPPTSKS